MPLAMQVKLLRVLQEKTLIRVGGTTEIPVDIRILAATNKDLKGEVERGAFRQDLFYRINVVTLHVPALAERRDDIPLLCRHFLQKFAAAQGKEIHQISDEVMAALLDYEFPGNIRELENIMERAVTLASGPTIEVSHLPADFQQPGFQVQRRQKKEFLTLEENEQEYITWVLKQMNGNKTKAAEGPREARLVVMGTSTMCRNQSLPMPYNYELVMNCFNWLAGKKDLKNIRPPARTGTRIYLDRWQKDMILYVSVMILPEVIMIIGLGVWWRRR
jgi:transcriptional regulator with GAF, ATPase, and Fis domain